MIIIFSLLVSLHVQLMTENVFDVLCVADMYLLPGLKRLCGKTLAKTICEENVLHMWKTAKLFRLSRLEDQCTEFMAKIIERVRCSDGVPLSVGRSSLLYLCCCSCSYYILWANSKIQLGIK